MFPDVHVHHFELLLLALEAMDALGKRIGVTLEPDARLRGSGTHDASEDNGDQGCGAAHFAFRETAISAAGFAQSGLETRRLRPLELAEAKKTAGPRADDRQVFLLGARPVSITISRRWRDCEGGTERSRVPSGAAVFIHASAISTAAVAA
jgi:hypothetical protein